MRKLTVLIVLLVAIASASALTTDGNDTAAVPDGTLIVLNLPKFDGNLLDLTNIWVEVKFDLSDAAVSLDNDSVTSATGTAKVNSSFVTFDSTVTLLKVDFDSIAAGDFTVAEQQAYGLDPTTGDPTGQFDATMLGDYAHHDFGTITRQDSGDIYSSVWGEYVGSGDFQITVDASYLTGATFDGSDGYFQGSTPSGVIYAEVVYNYIPEPATMALLGLGLAFLRKKKVA